jgi:hypothetical protein
MKMKALEVIEKYGLDARAALDVLINFHDYEFVCEQLCEVIDKCENAEDFAEFVNASFCRTTTDDEKHAVVEDVCSDDDFLRQLAEIGRTTDADVGPSVESDPVTKVSVEAAPLASTENCKCLEYVPDQEDLDFLAHAYLEKAIGYNRHYYSTGACDSSIIGCQFLARFEKVAEVIGEVERRKIIDDLDEREARVCGDEWQAFKSTWKDFWSTPADHEAILRLTASMPIDLSALDIGAGLHKLIIETRGSDHPDGLTSDDSYCEIIDAAE